MKFKINENDYYIQFHHERKHEPTLVSHYKLGMCKHTIENRVVRTGGKTICKIYKNRELISTGVSECTKKDTYVKKIGRVLSFDIAMKTLEFNNEYNTLIELYKDFEKVKTLNSTEFYYHPTELQPSIIDVIIEDSSTISEIINKIKQKYPRNKFDSKYIEFKFKKLYGKLK